MLELTCSGPAGSVARRLAVTVTPAGTPAALPLKVSADGVHLADSVGTPFLLNGDAAWSLIGSLTKEDAGRYLADRRARGFNTILVNLVEHKFLTHPPRNAYGDEPFLRPGDFSTPNDAYFAHADWVIQRAADNGILVLLVPAYLGTGGSDEGWYHEMTQSGAAKMRLYGEFLGRRYRDFRNILWVHGGDWNPPEKRLVQAVAQGIRQFEPDSLATVHINRDSTAEEIWGGESWLNVNAIYTWGSVYDTARDALHHSQRLPFILIESKYEGEPEGSAQRARAQAYQAMLTGAAGHVFGNSPIWHFNGPGLFRDAVDWQQALAGPGSTSMTHLKQLLTSLRWWTLEPDTGGRLVTGRTGSGLDRIAAATAADGSFALVYFPSARESTISLQRLSGPKIEGVWFDPATGGAQAALLTSKLSPGTLTIRTPDANAGGSRDWVLILTSTSAGAEIRTGQ
jgi:hypothetical protein